MLQKLSFTGLLILMAAVTASAYTLVFRDGRRVEIPSEFTVTKVTLTYELSPGFNQTVLLTLVDIPATERANNETAGGFFNHIPEEEPQSAPAPVARARVTLTNRDLEAIRARRIESEKLYEQRRVELGLPSVAQTRERREAEEFSMLERARDKADLEARDQAYWRGRARSLRSEIAANDAQITFVRARLGEVTPSGVTGLVFGSPYGIYGPQTAPNIRGTGVGVIGDGRTVPQYPNRGIFGPDGRRRNRGVYPNIYGNPNIYGYPNVYGYPNIYGYPNVYGYPNAYPADPNSQINTDERTSLTQRLDDLLATRAALNSRWQQLEDEARDARVPQVWLEP